LTPPDEAPFTEPWQAQAFALAVHLSERGVFPWRDFSTALAHEIAAAGETYTAAQYYDCWVDALERVLLSHGAAEAETLHALEHAWADAYRRTPHGMPVSLSEAP
jgi:nitrile hydratase accessory protein